MIRRIRHLYLVLVLMNDRCCSHHWILVSSWQTDLISIDDCCSCCSFHHWRWLLKCRHTSRRFVVDVAVVVVADTWLLRSARRLCSPHPNCVLVSWSTGGLLLLVAFADYIFLSFFPSPPFVDWDATGASLSQTRYYCPVNEWEYWEFVVVAGAPGVVMVVVW